jgi:DNA-binding response OmpR family regulator
MKSILVVDDEKDIVDALKYNLQKEGYAVLTARNGKQALEQAQHLPHLILLDVMMPEYDGFEVLKQLKKSQRTSGIPVMFLTARGSEVNEVLGLELGAQDYVVKPISIPKLLARVKNVLRAQELPEKGTTPPVVIGAIEIHPSRHTVLIDKQEVFFPKKEFDVLLHLARHQGDVVDRETLLSAVWGDDVHVGARTVDVHIRKVREKLGKHAECIETIKGVGYKMREPS